MIRDEQIGEMEQARKRNMKKLIDFFKEAGPGAWFLASEVEELTGLKCATNLLYAIAGESTIVLCPVTVKRFPKVEGEVHKYCSDEQYFSFSKEWLALVEKYEAELKASEEKAAAEAKAAKSRWAWLKPKPEAVLPKKPVHYDIYKMEV